MFGGIPNCELDAFAPMWSKFPSLCALNCSATSTTVYSELIPSHDDPRRVIADNAEVRQFNESYAETVSNVGKSLDDYLIDRLREPQFVADLNPQFHLSALTSFLFDYLKPFNLIDEYAAYRLSLNTGRKSPATSKLSIPRVLSPPMWLTPIWLSRRKTAKDVEVGDGCAGRIIPIDLVERVMLSDELASVENDRAALEATRSHIAEIIENLPEAEGETPWLKRGRLGFCSQRSLKPRLRRLNKSMAPKAPEG